MSETIVQRVQVTLEYPVVFTRDAFAPDNPALADVIGRREPARRHRVVAIADRNVVAARPINDSGFLATLGARDRAAGMAAAVGRGVDARDIRSELVQRAINALAERARR